MNLVGKILTVLILVMSLVFMSFAVAVYATHKSWKEVVTRPKEDAGPGKPAGLRYQLEELDARNEQLKDQQAQLQRKLDEQKADALQVRSKLETQLDVKSQELVEKEESLRKHREDLRLAVAGTKAAHETLETIRAEVGQLRKDIEEANVARDANFKEVVRLTDEMHQAVNELKRLKERNQQLVADLAKAREVLGMHDLKPEPELYSNTPPLVEGVVLAARPDMVEISIGSDDGIRKGHKLELVRVSGGSRSYVGRIEVVQVFPDKAVCTILRDYQKSQVQRGDRVFSRLQ